MIKIIVNFISLLLAAINSILILAHFSIFLKKDALDIALVALVIFLPLINLFTKSMPSFLILIFQISVIAYLSNWPVLIRDIYFN